MPAVADDDDFRLTALDWMAKAGTPLDVYARSGAVVRGLDRQLQDCLDLAERGIVPSGLDPAGERKTLAALLRHVGPELALIETEEAAVREAEKLGQTEGAATGEAWLRERLRRSGSGRTAAALRLYLEVTEPGEAVAFDHLSRPRYSGTELVVACCWEEPSSSDDDARARWAATRSRMWDAYESAFLGAVQAAVADGCRAELTDAVRLGRLGDAVVDGPSRRSPSLGHEGLGL